LQAMYAMVTAESSLHELSSKMSKFPQTMINVRLSDKRDVMGNAAVRDAIAAAETTLGRKGRVLLRPSGTEPVVRVMVEGEDEALVARMAHELAAVVQEQVA